MGNENPIVTDSYRHVITQEYARVSRFFINNPAMVLTLLYVFTSILGLSYTILLFNHFDITILSHLEIADFLLTALLQPMVFLYSFVLCIIYWLSHRADFYLRKKSSLYTKISEWSTRPITMMNPLAFFIISSLPLVLLVISATAEKSYKDFIAGNSQRFSVQTIYDIPVQERQARRLDNVSILADTTKYLWLYSPEHKTVYSLPHNNIALVTPSAIAQIKKLEPLPADIPEPVVTQ